MGITIASVRNSSFAVFITVHTFSFCRLGDIPGGSAELGPGFPPSPYTDRECRHPPSQFFRNPSAKRNASLDREANEPIRQRKSKPFGELDESIERSEYSSSASQLIFIRIANVAARHRDPKRSQRVQNPNRLRVMLQNPMQPLVTLRSFVHICTAE